MVLPSTFFVGLALQYFVKLSGGLFVPIAIHLFHNVVNGIIYGKILKNKSEDEVPEKATIAEEAVIYQTDRPID